MPRKYRRWLRLPVPIEEAHGRLDHAKHSWSGLGNLGRGWVAGLEKRYYDPRSVCFHFGDNTGKSANSRTTTDGAALDLSRIT
jgi:hypothetical protein